METDNKLAERNRKIELLMKVVRGEIAPGDLAPKRLLVRVGYGDDAEYYVNDRRCSKAEHDRHLSNSMHESIMITYGA